MASCRCWQPTPFFCSQRRWERRLCDLPLAGFLGGFTAIFWISYACWIAGSYAYIAATPDKLASFGIPWSLNLTSEAGFIIALLAGLVVGNFLPRFAVAIESGDTARMVYQDGHRDPGRSAGHCRHGAMGLATAGDVPRIVRDRRSVLDLLGAGLLRGAEVLQVQPRMGCAVGLRDLHLRGFRGHCDRCGNQGAAHRADHGVVACGDLRRSGIARSSLCGPRIPLCNNRWLRAHGWDWR